MRRLLKAACAAVVLAMATVPAVAQEKRVRAQMVQVAY